MWLISRGGLLDFWNGGANVLIFGVGEIIWGLKFQCPKCAICSLKFWEGEIIWVDISSISLPKPFS